MNKQQRQHLEELGKSASEIWNERFIYHAETTLPEVASSLAYRDTCAVFGVKEVDSTSAAA